VREQLAHVGGLDGVPVRPALRPASPAGEPEGFGYRQRANLTAAPDGRLGFLRGGSHQVHPVERCPLLASGLQDLPAQLGRHPAGAKVRLRRGADGGRLAVLEAAEASRTRFLPPEGVAWSVVRGNGKVVGGVLRRVAALGPRAIALVSCDPAALARDVRTLTDAGYPAAWVQPVDLFPQTAHIEALTALDPAPATSG
jgi:tRNA/tmRNA/rRNA uracil-C5-methylase (TrmA/RlmC/RlmD family)